MIVESIVLSFIVGFIRKGQFLHFGLVKIKGIAFFAAGALLQFTLFRFATVNGAPWQKLLLEAFYPLHLFSYGLILIPFVLNRHFKSLYVMTLGTLLNLIAIALNAGKMPVALPKIYDPTFDLGHTLLLASTRVKFLSDIIYIGPPYPLPKVLSVGDLFLIVGVFWFIQQVMLDGRLGAELKEIRAVKGAN